MFEGSGTTEAQKTDIHEKVSRQGYQDVINKTDSLLQSHSDQDELVIMIVNIIICYNSISNNLDTSRVKSWISKFSERLVESSKPDFQRKPPTRSWYMEKYVFIIELLVTKNLDKIDKEITNDIL